MLGELRTTALSPQKYYELYMRVWSELHDLRMFFSDPTRHGRSNLELYELVQHAGNILPRLYLLITVGAVYIQSKENVSAKDVLKDLVEMTKGVQHPIHGLFLRAYLSQASKDLLPDESEGNVDDIVDSSDKNSFSDSTSPNGSVTDSIDFVLQNFTEMNKLWVRMAHGGRDVRDVERREKERRELRDLVGKNLHVLSGLEGLTLGLYENTVLPKILEQIIQCKDDIAQPYLMDAVVQVFPDDFHAKTLGKLCDAVLLLKPSVNVGDVLSSLMDRLTSASEDEDSETDFITQFNSVDALGTFKACVANVVSNQPTLSARERLRMHASLMHFAVAAHGEKLELVDGILTACANSLGARAEGDASTSGTTPPPPMIVADPKAVKQLLALLAVPLEKYDVSDVLSLKSYPLVMGLLQPADARQMAVTIVKAVLKSSGDIKSVQQVATLFGFVKPLTFDSPDVNDETDDEDFEEEQALMARVVLKLRADDFETQLTLLQTAKQQFQNGGARRLKHALPPLAFAALRLGRKAANENKNESSEPKTSPVSKFILQFLHQTVMLLQHAESHEHALFLFLESARLADLCGAEQVAIDFFERAMGLYEEEVTDSRKQKNALALITGTLQRCVSLSYESNASLVDKAVAYASRLLKKPDRVAALVSCAQTMWGVDVPQSETKTMHPEGVSKQETSPDSLTDFQRSVGDPKAAFTCLEKALHIGTSSLEASKTTGSGAGEALLCLVTALNAHVWFFGKGCPSVGASKITEIVELINNESGSGLPSDVQAYYQNTLQYVEHQNTAVGAVAERFLELKI